MFQGFVFVFGEGTLSLCNLCYGQSACANTGYFITLIRLNENKKQQQQQHTKKQTNKQTKQISGPFINLSTNHSSFETTEQELFLSPFECLSLA